MVYHGDSPFLLDEAAHLFLRPAGGRGRAREVDVRDWRPHQERLLVRFVGVDDRDAAEALRGHELLVDVRDLPEPDEDELFLYEIPGLEVLLPDGAHLGVVREVTFPGDREVWVVDTPDGREVLFPVAEEFVTDVDLDARRVTIDPPPGLLDIYLGEDEGPEPPCSSTS